MYAFRKPFAVATFEGHGFGGLDLKTTLVISQVLGYTLSKYLGVKWVSEARRGIRLPLLLGLISAALAALAILPLLPRKLAGVALFFNGLPLGMIWGLVVRSLEGRRTSDFLLAGLSCSFIVASGVVKDIGRWLMTLGISEWWMPLATGLIFWGPFAVFATLLNSLPEPNTGDIQVRSARLPLSQASRWAFFRRFLPGFVLLFSAYFLLTAFRDFRDNYGIELFKELGYVGESALFTQTELPIAVMVLVVLGGITWVKEPRRAMSAVFGVMLFGLALMGVATFALDRGMLSGQLWMIAIGLGAYLAYVPFGSFLFDHIMANTRTVGTAVFAINLADGIGYTGSVGLQLFRDLLATGESRLGFFKQVTYLLSAGGVCLVGLAAWYFSVQSRRISEIAEQTERGAKPGNPLASSLRS